MNVFVSGLKLPCVRVLEYCLRQLPPRFDFRRQPACKLRV